jgi:hypothetical protein
MTKRILVISLSIALLLVNSTAYGQHRSSSRPYYGGGKHTESHGGHYAGSQDSHHKGGHYRNPKTSNHYGKHKP